MASLLRAVELGRTLRGQAGIRTRQPLAKLWLALPGGSLGDGVAASDRAALLELLSEELNLKAIEVTLTADDSKALDEASKLTPEYPAWMDSLGSDRKPGERRY